MTARDNMNPVETTLTQYIDQHRPQQEAFLAELVKVPSDNPPAIATPMASAPRNCSKGWDSRSRPTRCPKTRSVQPA